MKSLKRSLIEKWRRDVERKECEIITCYYVKCSHCYGCPLHFRFHNEKLLCKYYKELKLTKFQWSTVFAMLENIDEKYWTAGEFSKSKFEQVFNQVMKYHKEEK